MNLFGVSNGTPRRRTSLAEIAALLRRTDPDHTTPVEAHRLLIRVRKAALSERVTAPCKLPVGRGVMNTQQRAL